MSFSHEYDLSSSFMGTSFAFLFIGNGRDFDNCAKANLEKSLNAVLCGTVLYTYRILRGQPKIDRKAGRELGDDMQKRLEARTLCTQVAHFTS